jgi:hypothetical protein
MQPSKLVEMAQAKAEAVAKKDAKKAPPTVAPRGRGNSILGTKIRDYMKATKTRGNPKDFVLFIGNEMLDEWGKYQVNRNGEMLSPVWLVHKRDLHRVIGPKEAAKFWNLKLRCRTSYGQKEASRAKP